jgi:hypothetical protein
VLIQGSYEYIQLLRATSTAVDSVEYYTIALALAVGFCALASACCQREDTLEALQRRTAAPDSETDSSDDDDADSSDFDSSGVLVQQPRQQGQYSLVPQLASSAAMV